MFNKELLELFKLNGYRVREKGNVVKISYWFNAGLLSLFLFLTGIAAVAIGLLEDDYAYVIMGAALILAPIIHGRIRYPTRIIFNRKNGALKLNYNSIIAEEIRFLNIEGIIQDRKVENTSASPFRKGTQVIVYKHYLKLNGKKIRFLKVESVEDADQLMKVFIVIFNQLTRR